MASFITIPVFGISLIFLPSAYKIGCNAWIQLAHLILQIMDNFLYTDVAIFASCDRDPVVRTSRLTLGGHSALLTSLLRSLSVCDGCEGSLAVIIADEDRDTVRAALSKVVSAPGVTVIKGNLTL